ncbi:hypothetical protein VaNZ11_011428, partial [Volvox africanus]
LSKDYFRSFISCAAPDRFAAMPRRALGTAPGIQATGEFLRTLLLVKRNLRKNTSCYCGIDDTPAVNSSKTFRSDLQPAAAQPPPGRLFHADGLDGSGCAIPLSPPPAFPHTLNLFEGSGSFITGPPLACLCRSATQCLLPTTQTTRPPPVPKPAAEASWSLIQNHFAASSELKKQSRHQLALAELSPRPSVVSAGIRSTYLMCCDLRQSHTLRSYTTSPPDFPALGVTPELQERLSTQGLQTALPVQAAALPLILRGHNTAIKSCTGSGKTLAYLLPVIQLALERRRAAEAAVAAAASSANGSRKLATVISSGSSGGNGNSSNGSSSSSNGNEGGQQPPLAPVKRLARSLQAIIVAPSRELCIQIQRTAQDLIPGPIANRRLVQQLIGGANPRRQEAALTGGDGGVWPLMVVGTPGRVADMVTHGSLQVWNCPLLVLDEADQLYEQQGLRQHIDTICAHVGRRVQQRTPAADPGRIDGSTRNANTSASAARNDEVSPEDGSSLTADVQTSPRAGSPAPGSGSAVSAAGGGDGRQTIIVSASLDARNLDRYAPWCPRPELVALSSLQALPRSLVQSPKPGAQSSAAGQRPEVESSCALPGDTAEQDQAGLGTRPTWTAVEEPLQATRPGATCSSTRGDRPIASTSDGSASPGNSSGSGATTSQAEHAASAGGQLSDVLPPHLAHLYVLTHSKHRTDRVRRLMHALGAERALLFVPKQNQTMVTKYRLEARRMEVTILHGRLTKLERSNIMDAFRRGVFRMLIVTDLGARGLDLPDCDVVINFGPPADALSYAHRAGRTGRAGAPGLVVSIVTRLELPTLQRIARQLGVSLQAASVSHGTIAPGEGPEGDGEGDSGTAAVAPSRVGDSSCVSISEHEPSIGSI